MQTRNFIKLTGIALAGISIPEIAKVSTNLKGSAAVLINEIHYLRLDKGGVNKFVDAFLQKYSPNSKFTVKLRSANALGMKASDARPGSAFTQDYQLSTDFLE